MKLGEYELLERIAVGGMAEVYRGRVVGAEGFEKFVAIKRVLPHLARDERFVEMLLTEARIHSTLSHANIVQIHDLGVSEEGEHFIVFEFVDGQDLRALLDAVAARKERIPDALALYIAGEILQGLHFAHEMRGADGQPLGLIHRDVSPSNVLLTYAGEVKVSDFGLAKRRHDQSVVGSLKGKLAYMSPEQAQRATLDRRTDIFSVGAVFFEMLSGRRLRDITDEVKGWRQVASGERPTVQSVRPDLPEPLQRILEKTLSSNPADRPTDAAAVGAVLREVRSQLPVTAGATELRALLMRVLPPGSRRSDAERSKVVRISLVSLGPDGQPLPARGRTSPPPLPPEAAGPRRATPVETPVAPRSPAPALAPAAAPPPPPASAPPAATRPFAPPTQPPFPPPTATVVPEAPPELPTPLPAPPPVAISPDVAAQELRPPAGKRRRRPLDLRTMVLPRRRFGGRVRVGVFVAVGLAILVTAAVIVHVAVMPLDVVLSWGRPAYLWISSDPSGAQISIDGVLMDRTTPTRTIVRRDRVPHLLELARPGFHTVRRTLYYDRSSRLSVTMNLPAETMPAIEPLPVAPPAPAPTDQGFPAQ